jgi:site-specific DNA recombinase
LSSRNSSSLRPITDNQERQTNVRAAVYARISSPNQKFNYSINEQIACCRKYVAQRGWTINYIFFDEQSGRTIDRPKFQLMLKKAQSGFFDVIVFWKLDRFCRSLVDLVNVERVLRGYGVALSSVTEYVDTTTSVGRFNFRSIGSVAELERELIGERARLGLHALARKGKWPNSHPPLGFSKKNDGKLAINQEAKLVVKIFEMYLENPALPQVAFDLNEKGVRTKQGKKWNGTSVRNILTNAIYIGNYHVAGVNHYIEKYRIVSNTIFRQVQQTLHRYSNGESKRPRMPENRRNAEIDAVFNQFLTQLNSYEDGTTHISGFKSRIVKNEKELFKLLNKRWHLVKVNGKEFMIKKQKKQAKKPNRLYNG